MQRGSPVLVKLTGKGSGEIGIKGREGSERKEGESRSAAINLHKTLSELLQKAEGFIQAEETMAAQRERGKDDLRNQRK